MILIKGEEKNRLSASRLATNESRTACFFFYEALSERARP
jgi:hypothetical protein